MSHDTDGWAFLPPLSVQRWFSSLLQSVVGGRFAQLGNRGHICNRVMPFRMVYCPPTVSREQVKYH